MVPQVPQVPLVLEVPRLLIYTLVTRFTIIRLAPTTTKISALQTTILRLL